MITYPPEMLPKSDGEADVIVVDNDGSTRKIVPGMSDVLGFAKCADAGEPIRIYSASEFLFEGIRFNAGTYEIRKVADQDGTKIDPPF